MDELDTTAIKWLAPWSPVIDPAARDRYEAELQRELGPDHPLLGRPALAIAWRSDCDDVLFAVRNPGELAVVHLTYSSDAPERTGWPETQVFSTVAAFVEECMMPEHEDFSWGEPGP